MIGFAETKGFRPYNESMRYAIIAGKHCRQPHINP